MSQCGAKGSTDATDATVGNYHRQEFSAMYECPLCNFRDFNPSNITEHLKLWHGDGDMLGDSKRKE